MKPIYKPSGAAAEYAEWALNIYTGCPHRCYYCFAPTVLHRDREEFHSHVEPRKNIVGETAKQIEHEGITGRLINLCFLCDPYPTGYDTSTTRDIIKLLKDNGNHVQILTKNGRDSMRDFDLLDSNDRFGITYAGYSGYCSDPNYIPREEPNSGSPHDRLLALCEAYERKIFTWISCEPVLNAMDVLNFIQLADYVDLWKIGKLNYYPSCIDWKWFGEQVEAVCRSEHRNYCIKDGLRKEMESGT
jgi:DNA repair photolyase